MSDEGGGYGTPPGQPRDERRQMDVGQRAGGVRDYLHSRFGSGYEAVTGFSGYVYRHDDSASRLWMLSSVFWFVVVTTFGIVIATELAVPEAFSGIPWLMFGRARPVHVQGVLYAWLTMMYWGAILYMAPRLLGTEKMWSESLSIWNAWVYNVAMAVGFFAIMTGGSQGREWQEFPWIIGVVIIATFAVQVFNLLKTVNIRSVRPIYVSLWWSIAAPLWFIGSIFIGKVMWRPGVVWPFGGWLGNPSGYLPTGIHDAMINWWGNHNLFGLWLTPILIAVCYYFVPRITNTPLYGHTLSLISFWGLVFVYTGVGDHHLLQTPTPGWLKTIASVNSVAILIPVFAFFTNVFLTMRGQWNKFFTSLPLRYVLTGFFFYILANIQGALMAVQPFNVYIHFTYFIISHSHLALLGGFTILGMGVVYYVLPHVLNKQPYSETIAEYQYWLVTLGFLVFFSTLVIGAFIQGQGWLTGQNEVLVLPSLRLWNLWRGVGCGMIYAAGLLQAFNIAMTYFTDTGVALRRRAARDSVSALATGAVKPIEP
ncbi:MAG TPA: cbb3-type cytochrome c oxidase subunit I [Coriobacteriia bacterium]|jgi:cbb3-type cytochrome c oxidase subunit I